MASDLEQEIKAVENVLKAELEARDTEEMQIDVYTVRWQKVSSNRFDTKAFKTAMPELHKQFTRETETRRFTVA